MTDETESRLRALVDQLGQLITELRAIADAWAQHLDQPPRKDPE